MTRDLIKISNVEVICTMDDPNDNLEYHLRLREVKEFGVKMLPSFRPDNAFELNQAQFTVYIVKLGEASVRKLRIKTLCWMCWGVGSLF